MRFLLHQHPPTNWTLCIRAEPMICIYVPFRIQNKLHMLHLPHVLRNFKFIIHQNLFNLFLYTYSKNCWMICYIRLAIKLTLFYKYSAIIRWIIRIFIKFVSHYVVFDNVCFSIVFTTTTSTQITNPLIYLKNIIYRISYRKKI